MQQLCNESSDLLKQAVQLRVNAGERIFILQKDEINSRTTSRSSSSRRSRSSNASETRARALAEAAKKKVEWQYAKLEMQKKVELKMKECEIEEMQRKKDYERAEAGAAALAKVEEEEEEDQKPCLIAWGISLVKLVKKIMCVNIWQRFLLPLLTQVLLQAILWITSRTPQLLL